jgi:two-component system response regulator VicR
MAEKKILIVDYDKKSIETLKNIFSPHNLHVITATDGQSAYEKFVEENPDIILLEPMLPKLHGFELAKKIREETEGETPIIIVTALYKGSQYKNEAIKSFGVVEYFEKPYNDETLLNAVLNIIYDEVPIEEELPDPEDVIKTLSDMADSFLEKGKK